MRMLTAASIAGLMITTEATVAEKPEKKGGAGGGMPAGVVWAAWVVCTKPQLGALRGPLLPAR